MSRKTTTYMLVALSAALLLAGCSQGSPSKSTPIHLNPNMDYQPKYQPQEASGFFADGAMRTPVPGTVARGELRDDTVYYTGKNPDGTLVKTSPVEITAELLDRGEERFNIYCSVCHSRVGDGKGIITEYEYVPPLSLHDERIRNIEDGHLFDVISNGIRNMPSYRRQIPVADRWAIVGYVRALQRSQNATLPDIPEELRDRFRQGRNP